MSLSQEVQQQFCKPISHGDFDPEFPASPELNSIMRALNAPHALNLTQCDQGALHIGSAHNTLTSFKQKSRFNMKGLILTILRQMPRPALKLLLGLSGKHVTRSLPMFLRFFVGLVVIMNKENVSLVNPKIHFFSKNISMISKAVLMIFIFFVLSILSGCADGNVNNARLVGLERMLEDYYKNNDFETELIINKVLSSEFVEGFCVLGSYEEGVTFESENSLNINNFLVDQEIQIGEKYWYLIIQTSDSLRIAHLKMGRVPLISPRPSFQGTNCVKSTSIKFSKVDALVRKYPLKPIVIDVKPGGLK